VLLTRFGIPFEEGDQAVGIRMGKGTQEHRMHHIEHGNIGSDTESQNADHGQRKGGISEQVPRADPQIPEELVELVCKPDLPRCFLCLHAVPKTARRGLTGLRRRYAALLQVSNLGLDVESDFFGKIFVKLPTVQQKADSKPCLTSCGVHCRFLASIGQSWRVRCLTFSGLPGQAVKAGAPVIFGTAPLGCNPTLQQQALQGGVERALFDRDPCQD
jgi:hypothetical protein